MVSSYEEKGSLKSREKALGGRGRGEANAFPLEFNDAVATNHWGGREVHLPPVFPHGGENTHDCV